MKQYATVFPSISSPHAPLLISHGSLCLLTLTVCCILSQAFTAAAQTNASPPLPPAALEVLNKGIIAANVPDYLLAIRYFEDARKLCPDAPIVYFNLGLAESKIPGRELRAIAWFGAYLAANPTAPNAPAVKEKMVVLVVKSQSTRARLVKAVQEAALTSGLNGSIANASYSARESTSDSQPSVKPVVLVSDWLQKLDDDNKSSDCPLNTGPFLDLAGYLKSLPRSDNARKVVESFRETAERVAKGQNVIDEMLKRQAVFSEQQAGLIESRVSRENATIATSVQLVSVAAGTDNEGTEKQFKVRKGRTFSAPKGTLFISSFAIAFVENEHPEKKKWGFPCTDVNEVRASGVPWARMVFWIRVSKDEHMFITDTGSEARTIVETVRVACMLDQKGKRRI